MNKHIIIILLLAPLMSFGQGKEFHLKGHIKNWKGQDSMMFIYTKNNALAIDTIIAIDGRFEVKGSVEQPVMAYISSMRPVKATDRRDNTRFYLEPGLLKLEGTDSLRNSLQDRSQLNTDAENLESITAPILKRLVEVKKIAIATPKDKRQTPEYKGVEKEYYALQDSMKQVRIRFIKANPKSFVSLETLEQLAGSTMNYPVTAPMFEALDPSLKELPLGKEMDAKLTIAKKTRLGTVMPAFSSLDTSRNELHLNDVVSKGKVTLVDFWASWCAPCRAENPNVVKAYDSFHAKGFEIISVSLDDNAKRWKDAIVKDGMPWYHVSGLKKWDEPVAKFLGVNAVPDNFLLDAQGRVLARGLKGEALYKKIEELTR